MPPFTEDILGVNTPSPSKEERLRVKQKMIDKIIDMYFDSEVDGELHEKFLAWLADPADSDMKEAAMRKKFDMIFDEKFQEEPVVVMDGRSR